MPEPAIGGEGGVVAEVRDPQALVDAATAFLLRVLGGAGVRRVRYRLKAAELAFEVAGVLTRRPNAAATTTTVSISALIAQLGPEGDARVASLPPADTAAPGVGGRRRRSRLTGAGDDS